MTQTCGRIFQSLAAFWNMQQHGEIGIIHFTFILMLFLPCRFWCYPIPIFQCIYHLLCFYISVFWFSSLYCLHVNVFIFVVWDTTHQDVCSQHNCLVRSFWEISKYKIIFSKVSDFFLTLFRMEGWEQKGPLPVFPL